MGFGPDPVSPFTAPFGEVGQGTIVMIDYDNESGRLADTGSSVRDEESPWGQFTVGARRIPIPVGAHTFAVADLGVSTIGELNERGFTAER